MAKVLSKAKSVEFKLHAPQAKKVVLSGSFNNWNIKSLTAKKDGQGSWQVMVSLKPGKYEYKFLVDGSWINDPKGSYTVYNPFGTQNSVIEVK